MSESGDKMKQSSVYEEMGESIFAYQLGHIGFLDLIHQVGEKLGLPPLRFNHQDESKADQANTKKV